LVPADLGELSVPGPTESIFTPSEKLPGTCGLYKESWIADRGIAIAYDSRYKSPEFALEAAKVFAGNGIKAFLFDELRPTPELSFT